jgi:hypothetical protein
MIAVKIYHLINLRIAESAETTLKAEHLKLHWKQNAESRTESRMSADIKVGEIP